MPRHRQGPSFIQYVLPQALAVQEGKGKPKPRPVTTMAVGEESGNPPPDRLPSNGCAGVEGSFPPFSQLTPTPA